MISGDEYTEWARNYWYKEVQIQPWDAELTPGDIVVLESPDAGVGEIGSYNSLDMRIKGAAADSHLGRCPGPRRVRRAGGTDLRAVPQPGDDPGPRGVRGLRRPGDDRRLPGSKTGDIVVGDGDGVIAVPLEVAEQVAKYARQENENDRRGRRALYEKAGLPLDDSVR